LQKSLRHLTGDSSVITYLILGKYWGCSQFLFTIILQYISADITHHLFKIKLNENQSLKTKAVIKS
jgi:hypothetical protein